jgi:hypothetical protein
MCISTKKTENYKQKTKTHSKEDSLRTEDRKLLTEDKTQSKEDNLHTEDGRLLTEDKNSHKTKTHTKEDSLHTEDEKAHRSWKITGHTINGKVRTKSGKLHNKDGKYCSA